MVFLGTFSSVQQATATLCILSSLYALSPIHLLLVDANDLCGWSSLFKWPSDCYFMYCWPAGASQL